MPAGNTQTNEHLGLYSPSQRTSYCQISRKLNAARYWFRMIGSLWLLTGRLIQALLLRLSNVRWILSCLLPISQPLGFTRFGGKTLYHLVIKALCERCGYTIAIVFCSCSVPTSHHKAVTGTVFNISFYVYVCIRLGDNSTTNEDVFIKLLNTFC